MSKLPKATAYVTYRVDWVCPTCKFEQSEDDDFDFVTCRSCGQAVELIEEDENESA